MSNLKKKKVNILKIKTDIPEEEAKIYLKKYNLEKFFHHMINNILEENPKNKILYMIKYIAGEMSKEERDKFKIKIPQPYPQNIPKNKFPNLSNSISISRKILTKDLFKKLKHKKTKFNGSIYDIIKLSINSIHNKIGCLLSDGDSIEVFSEFFFPIIEKIHDINIINNEKINHYNKNDIVKLNENFFPNLFKITTKCNIMRFIISRNLSGFPFLIIDNKEQKIEIENILSNIINKLIDKNFFPFMNKYTSKDEEFFNILDFIDYNNFLTSDIDKDYNYRSIYSCKDRNLIFLINFVEHFQIIETRKKEEINPAKMYNKIYLFLQILEETIKFEYSEKFGYLTSEINKIGSGFTIYSELEIYNLNQIKIIGGDYKGFLLKSKHDSYIIKELKDHVNFCIYYSKKLSNKNDLNFLETYLKQLNRFITFDQFTSKLHSLYLKKLNISESTKDISLKISYDNNYENYKYKISPSGITFNYLMSFYMNNQLNPFGILIKEKDDYKIFSNFFIDYISKSQNFKIPENNYFEKIYEEDEIDEYDFNKIQFEPKDKFKKINISLCLMRNIENFFFPTHHESSDDKIEELILTFIDSLSTINSNFGNYYSLTEKNQKDITNKIIEENQLMLFHKDDMKNFNLDIGYPFHRGVIKFKKEHIFVIINDVDHLKFFLNDKPLLHNIQNELNEYFEIIDIFSNKFNFCKSDRIGYITSSPRFVGNGLLIKVTFPLDYINKEDLDICFENTEFIYKIVKEGENKEKNIVEIINKITIGISERKIVFKLLSYLKKVFYNSNNRRLSKY